MITNDFTLAFKDGKLFLSPRTLYQLAEGPESALQLILTLLSYYYNGSVRDSFKEWVKNTLDIDL